MGRLLNLLASQFFLKIKINGIRKKIQIVSQRNVAFNSIPWLNLEVAIRMIKAVASTKSFFILKNWYAMQIISKESSNDEEEGGFSF